MTTQAELIKPRTIDPNRSYHKRYTLRRSVNAGDTVVTTVPRDVIAHAARQKGMTVDEFTSYYDAMWLYDGAEGAYLTFVPKTA